MGLRVWGSFLIACGAAAFAGCLMAGCNRGNAAAAMSSQMPPPSVTVAEAVARDVPLYIDEIGKAVATESVTVMPQVAGRVDSVHFEEGTDVKKGDLLFQIDARPFQAALDQAKAAVAQDLANLDFAKSDFARVEALKGTSAVSQTEYDQKKSAVAVGQATVEAGQAAVKTAQLNLEYCEIRSPINGRSGQRLVDPGNIVKENETALVTIQRIDPIYADFTIPENRLEEVRSYMSTGTLKTIVELPPEAALPTTQSTTSPSAPSATAAPTTEPTAMSSLTSASASPERVGELSMLDNTIQPNAGTIRMRAIIPNRDEYFWPGQFVKVRLVLVDQPHAILVPNAAIQIGQLGTYVYVVKHDAATNMDLAEIRPVKTGQREGDMVVIDSGLQPNEQVITTGQLMVMPGGPVNVVGAPPAGGAASAGASGGKS